MYKNSMNSYHHSTGYLSCTKNLMVPGSLLLQINALQTAFNITSCFKTILIHYKQYCDGIYNYILNLIVFGLLTTLLKYWTGCIKLIRPQELVNLIVTILLHIIYEYPTQCLE